MQDISGNARQQADMHHIDTKHRKQLADTTGIVALVTFNQRVVGSIPTGLTN